MPSVLITFAIQSKASPSPIQMLEAGGYTVRLEPTAHRASAEDLIELVQGHDAVIAAAEPYTRELFERADTLKHVARWGVGYDRVDVPAATDAGVVVTTTQGANDWGVADHAFALILGLAHGIVANDRDVRAGRWARPVGSDVWRKTLGVVGLGRIGKGVARRAQGFEMAVLASEPEPDQAFVHELGVELVPAEELLGRADYVTLHLPASAETRHWLNQERLAKMKPSAYVVNTARGTLIDEDALYAALTEGRIGGAGLDVRELEPPTDTRFDELPNVILTSHVAGVTDETVAAMGAMAVESILQAARGDVPHGLLNSEVWERRRC